MEQESLSLSVRLRRSSTETAQVSVPITEDLTTPDDEGNRKIDVDKVIETALRLGAQDSIQWELERDPEITLHPIQNPPGQQTGTTQ